MTMPRVDDDPTQPPDDEMRARLAGAAEFTTVILRRGPHYGAEGADAIVWEHGRRNFRLREHGLLRIVCPVMDDTDVCGIGIFAATVDQVRELMAGDPGVSAGVFVYDTHPCRGFPGDSLG